MFVDLQENNVRCSVKLAQLNSQMAQLNSQMAQAGTAVWQHKEQLRGSCGVSTVWVVL